MGKPFSILVYLEVCFTFFADFFFCLFVFLFFVEMLETLFSFDVLKESQK